MFLVVAQPESPSAAVLIRGAAPAASDEVTALTACAVPTG